MSRWLLPVALVIPSALAGQDGRPVNEGDCSLSQPLETKAYAIRLSSADSRTRQWAEISRPNAPVFAYSSMWTPPAFAPPARQRGNALPRFLARNPLLAKPLIRKWVNQVAGRELFDSHPNGHRRISIAPHLDPGSDQYGVRVKLSLARPD